MALEFDQRSWRHEHGLPPGDRVFAVLQTRDGYLWIATQYGLARFDGQTFTVFNLINTPELASDHCATLAEDTEGNLWIGTKQGLIRKSGPRFTSMAGKLGPRFAPFPPVSSSRSGGVWVGGAGIVAHIQNDAFTTYPQGPDLPLGKGMATALVEDKAGFVWVGTETGFGRLDVRQRRFEVSQAGSGLGRLPVLSLWESEKGELWIVFAEFFPNGLAFPKSWLASLIPAEWPNGLTQQEQWFGPGWNGRFMLGDRNGNLWGAAGAGGIHHYRRGVLEFLPMLGTREGDFALCAFVDREDNLWVGTDKSGLQRWSPRRVRTYTTQDGLADDNVWSICETHDGRVLVGTDGGVTQFENGRATALSRPDGSIIKEVRAVAEDLEGTIWIGTMRSLECFRNGLSTPVRLPGEWEETKIRALQPARDGSMWVGTVRGLTRLHKNERRKYTTADGLVSNEVRAILEDRAGDLWVGTLGGGLSRLRNGHFQTLNSTNGLSSDNVWALHEDADGVLWVGTDNGLTSLDQGRITSISRAQGLPDSLVNFIISDDSGRLWIGHDRGLYALQKRQIREFARGERTTVSAMSHDESDGFLSVETNGQKSFPAACRTRDGRLWLPTTQGVAVIDPARLSGNDVPPLAAIEEIRANGEQVFTTSPDHPTASPTPPFLGAAGLHLKPGSARVLEFHYTGNSFVAPEKTRFRYRLKGLDDHWIDAGTRRQAYFANLNPGEYQFQVIACSHRGIWQEQGASIAFHLLPFFYETWWFYSACATAAALVVGLGVAWRVRELRRIHELQRTNALNEQRRQIARDIHDELGASLTHIMRLSERARGAAAQPDSAQSPVNRIASIAGEAVDHIGDIVWANNPEYDTLEDLAAFLREHAAALFADSSMKVRLDFPETVPSQAVTGLFRRHVVLLMKEALQNVFKHAGARNVNVRLALREGLFELEIADDGRGFDTKEARPPSNGLLNMRHRVSELRGTLDILSQPGQGTTVRFRLPLPRAAKRGS